MIYLNNFQVLLNQLYIGLSYPFTWLESIFGAFGLSFLILFAVMIVIWFFVRNFMRIFF